MENKETPLMKQHTDIKKKYPGALLLFRVGDFYETFGEDAIKASELLEIVLTKRANGVGTYIELAGFPYHSLDNYLPKLIRAGHRVAICDQLEDPRFVKGIVKRGVTELVTPGLSFHENLLDKKSNNFLASLFFEKDMVGISLLDVSTGEFLVSEGSLLQIQKIMNGFSPSEILFAKHQKEYIKKNIPDTIPRFGLDDWVFKIDYAYQNLTEQMKTSTLKGFGIEQLKLGIIAAGSIIQYLKDTEHKNLQHIYSIRRIEEQKYVWLDPFTIRNLELIYPYQQDGTSLLQIMDRTLTPMGSRLLKKWIILPLKEKNKIEERLDTVDNFIQQTDALEQIRNFLKNIGDIERLISKVAMRRINPRELLYLKKAMMQIAPLKKLLLNIHSQKIQTFGDTMNPCELFIQKIETSLKEEAGIIISQGNIIKDNVHTELDKLRKISQSGKEYLTKMQQQESTKTGIPSLKISFNKVFGYYLEVTNVHKDKVPTEWIRKQTLTNAERYITPELKEYEEKIITAEEKIISIEQELYQQLIEFCAEYVEPIQQNAHIIAELDCLACFAVIAKTERYHKPFIADDTIIKIQQGRHPVIESQLPIGEKYIPNDLYLDDSAQQILIITGPNMSGKSAFLRQTALIVLMAQMGSYIPAEAAHIGIIDKLFTRVGASDNLSRGESTFMVEMTETANILNNISERSLILMDEIGRGTSTYDGISIAWAIVEYLHNHLPFHPKTLFATHYHELNQLEHDNPRIKNFHISIKEIDKRIIFLRKLVEGGSQHSFGIHVAKMAGIPQEIITRSYEIMHSFETENIREKEIKKIKDIPKKNTQMLLFEEDPLWEKIKQQLTKIDINTLSPVEALLKLNELILILKKER